MKQLIFILLAIIGVSQAQTIQYIGAPTTTVISRGNFRTDSIFYLPKRTKLPTDTAALRYQISDSSLYAWTGSQWRKVGSDADTLVYSTRAWRQKGDDSLAARINLKVNISDTASMLTPYLRKADTSSMLTNYIRHAGYGLTKSGQSFLVDTLNIATRAWRQKGIDSVVSIIPAAGVGGSGTTNYIPKFTASTTIGNSLIYDNGSSIGIGSTAGSYYVEARKNGTADIVANSTADNNSAVLSVFNSGGTSGNFAQLRAYGNTTSSTLFGSSTNKMITLFSNSDALMTIGTISGTPLILGTNNTERLRIFANGRIGINTTTDAGYQLDINGTLRSVNGANFATTSGNVGIGTASPAEKLDVTSTLSRIVVTSTTNSNNAALYFNAKNSGGTNVQGGVYFIPAATPYLSLSGDNSGTHLNVTSAGNVGIGTASPNARLTVGTASGTLGIPTTATFYGTSTLSSSVGTVGIFSTESAGVGVGPILTFGGQTGNAATPYPFAFIQGSKVDITAGNYAGQLDFFTVPADGGVPVRRLRISGDGELLINTTSDAGDYKLQVSGNIYNTGSAVLAATSGNVGVGTTTPTATASKAINIFGASAELHFTNSASGTTGTDGLTLLYSASDAYFFNYESGFISFGTANTERGRINSAGEWIIDASGTDAGDYKLQVVGNARIGTGKLDIASNTTFGLGVARSGTSEVAGQIYNSNGILYLGAESSAGGQIFSGSSAYAAVIGSGANYPLQFAANNITRATLTTNGNFMIGFPTDTYFYRLQVNGSIFSNNQIIAQNAAAQLNIDSSTNISPLYISNQSLTGSSAQGLFYGSTTWNTTGNPSLIDIAITNTASGSDANYIKISDGSNIFRVTKAAEVVTAAPTGGSIRKWKLGEAATVSPTSPNRTIRVEIDGTVYYLHAKTTND